MKKFFNRDNLLDLLFIFCLSLVPLLWYKSHNSFAIGHDLFFPLDPLVLFKDRMFLWSGQLPLGFNYSQFIGLIMVDLPEVFLSLLGLPVIIVQKITFMYWFFVLGVSAYILASVLTRERFIKLFMVVFYVFNHFFLQAWFIAERATFSIAIAFPLLIAILILFFQKKISPVKSAILFNLVLFFFNGGGSLPLFGGVLVGITLTFLFFGALFIIKDRKKAIRPLCVFLFLGSGIFIPLNAYYLFPLFSFAKNSYGSLLAGSGGVEGISAWIDVISKNASMINLFRLQGIPDWYDNNVHIYANFFLNNPLLIFISFLFPVLAFFSLFLPLSRIQKIYTTFFSLLALFSMIFMAGSHPPLGSLYMVLVERIPGFAAFRTPFYKFAYPLWITYGFLIGTTLVYITRLMGKKTKIFLQTMCILCVLLYNYPFFLGNFFIWNKPFTTMIDLPPYVFEFMKWENSLSDKDGQILYLPEQNEDWKVDMYTWNYFSFSPLPSLFATHPYILNSRSLAGQQRVLINGLYTSLKNNNIKYFTALNNLFGIEYIVLRNDFNAKVKGYETESPLVYKKILNGNTNFFSYVKDIGAWSIYKIDKGNPLVVSNVTTVEDKEHFGSDVSAFLDFYTEEMDRKLSSVLFTSQNISQKIPKKEVIFADCIDCSKTDEFIPVSLPYIRILPDFALYPLITLKEQKAEKLYVKKRYLLINHLLLLSTKRLSEIKQLVVQKRSEKSIAHTLEEYVAIIEKINKELNKGDDNREEEKMLFKVNRFFKEENAILQRISDENTLPGKTISELRKAQEKLINLYYIYKKKEYIYPPLTLKHYYFSVERDDTYDIYIEKEKLPSSNPVTISLDNKLSTISANSGENEKFLVMKDKVLTKGEHALLLGISSPEERILTKEVLSVQDGCNQYSASLSNKNIFYSLKFSYRSTLGDGPYVKILEKMSNGKEDIIYSVSLEKTTDWKSYADRFQKKNNGNFTLFFCSQVLTMNPSMVEFRDIIVAPVYIPKVAVKKTDIRQTILPQVQIKKINQTTFEYSVKGARDSFILILPQQYDMGWEASIDNVTLPKSNHYIANLYQNGFFIDKKGAYSVVVTFAPQRPYIKGWVISLVILVACCTILIVKGRKHNEKN